MKGTNVYRDLLKEAQTSKMKRGEMLILDMLKRN